MTLEQIEETIRWLKNLGFEAEDLGAMWIVGNSEYSGYDNTELMAWCDLVLDPEIMYDILKDYCCE